ncbi:MAG: hypothetical protein V3T72_07215 [Thermoanaerobaculia bacterium]
MKKELSAHQIGELLRSADPLREDDGPRDVDVARMWRTVLAETRPAAKSWRFAPAMAAAALLVALLAGFAMLESRPRGADPAAVAATRERPSVPASDTEEPGRRQQVQFVTANGTRVIWVLSSDLSL